MMAPDYGRSVRRTITEAGETPTSEQIVQALRDNAAFFGAVSADNYATQIRLYPDASAAARAEAKLAVVAELEVAIRAILSEWFVRPSGATEEIMLTAATAFDERLAALSDGGAT
jgi:hypothetical protein